MKVLIPSALQSYTGTSRVEAEGATLAGLLTNLDRRYAGIRFRIVDEQDCVRRHIRIFVNGVQVDRLAQPLTETDQVNIVQALSGG